MGGGGAGIDGVKDAEDEAKAASTIEDVPPIVPEPPPPLLKLWKNSTFHQWFFQKSMKLPFLTPPPFYLLT